MANELGTSGELLGTVIGFWGHGVAPVLWIAAIAVGLVCIGLLVTAVCVSDHMEAVCLGLALAVFCIVMGLVFAAGAVHTDNNEEFAENRVRDCVAALDEYQMTLDTSGSGLADAATIVKAVFGSAGHLTVSAEAAEALEERGCTQSALPEAVTRWRNMIEWRATAAEAAITSDLSKLPLGGGE